MPAFITLAAMETELCRPRKDKNTVLKNFRIPGHLKQAYNDACQLLGKNCTQAFLAHVAATITEARRVAAQETAAPVPEFEMLTLDEARLFLKPYFHGRPPSAATLERRIADGILVAEQDHPSRTAPLRIYKASLVRWMRRLGKQFDADFDD